ncbi:MAG: terminase family protein [Myxococcales bacterium]
MLATLTLPSGKALPSSAAGLTTLVSGLPRELQVYLDWQRRWTATARPNQLLPETSWTEAGILAGRGFGKTRVGAEWITRATYEDPSGFDACVIAPTYSDVKFTCFEGESGILSVLPPELLIEHNKSDTFVKIKNIAGGVTTIRGFTAEKPERLRGPQHCRGWFDELAAWQYAEETWDMAQFGLRLGSSPQVLWTTTPKPRDIIRKLTAPQDKRIIVRGSTFDNKANLPDSFFKALEQYEGTVIGRQELHGELIDPEETGIIKRSWFRLWPADKALPRLDWIIMSLDTAYTEKSVDKKGDPDPTACSVWGVFEYKKSTHIMLLDCWDDHLGLPGLMKRVKKELNTAYGDDEDQALIKPMFGGSKPMTSGRKPDILLIEDKGSGISLRQMLAEVGIEAYAYNPGRADKLSRLHIVSPVFAQKRVWLPESPKFPGKARTWCDAVVTQLCSFAGSGSIKHDDHVDACTQAIRLCMDKGLIRLIKDKPTNEADKPLPRAVVNPYTQ